MKLLICGYGFVGKAHALALERENVKIHIYDPAYDIYKERLGNPDAVIVCVSTPQAKDGFCDMSNVYNAIENVEDDNVPILIKSTISLEGWDLIKRLFPNKEITFSPEYLRAAHAWEDFKNQTKIQLGGGDVAFWTRLLQNALNVDVEIASAEELILSKYFVNSFLATKVSFFNQVYDLCNKVGVDYSNVAYHITADPRIGDSHSYIGEDRGFGGHCFPKDTSAIVKTASLMGYDLSLIRTAIEYNNDLKTDTSNVVKFKKDKK